MSGRTSTTNTVQRTPPTADVPVWTLGDRMRKARELAGHEMADMAALMPCSRNSVRNWERGHTEPTASTVKRWAALTGVPVWWLIAGDATDDEGVTIGEPLAAAAA